jgi:hypothetical protein
MKILIYFPFSDLLRFQKGHFFKMQRCRLTADRTGSASKVEAYPVGFT